MKKLKRKTAVLALFAGLLMGAGLGCTACSNPVPPPAIDNGGSQTDPGDNDRPDETPDVNPDEKPDENPEKPDGKDPAPDTPPEEDPAEKLKKGVEKFDEFLEKAISTQNFTCSQAGGGKELLAEIDGGNAKMTEAGRSTYYEGAENGNFSYVWSDELELWEKDFSETTSDSLISSLFGALKEIKWDTFDEEAQKLSGNTQFELDGSAASAPVEADLSAAGALSLVLRAKSGEVEIEIGKVGGTAVSLPAFEQVRDKTLPVENIYEIVDGEYQWNIPLLFDIFDKWMKGDNQYGKDYTSRLNTDNYITKQILYIRIRPDLEKFCVGLVIEKIDTNENGFNEYSFSNNEFHKYKSKIYTELKAGHLQTKEDFLAYLNATLPRDFGPNSMSVKMEYSTDTATAEQQTEFKALTKNVLDRLETVGLQEISINNEGQITTKFAHAKVLFGFKTPNSGTGVGSDLGNKQAWHQYYLVEIDGKIEFINFIIDASIDGIGDAIYKVVNNSERRWKVSALYEQELDAGNLELYQTYWYEHGKTAV